MPKKIELLVSATEKAKTDPTADTSEPMSTRFLIMHCLNTTPKDGFSLKIYRERNRIADALEKTTGNTLELEDYDFKLLKETANAVKWPARSKFIYEFLEALENQ